MTIPSRFNCSPRSAGEIAVAVAMIVLTISLRFGLGGSLIIYLDFGFIAQGADHLVASGDDLVPFLQPAQHLNVGSSGDAFLHLAELSLLAVNHDNALQLLPPCL